MRQALGIAVFSGMLGVTLFGIFLTPVFFDVIDRLDATAPVPISLGAGRRRRGRCTWSRCTFLGAGVRCRRDVARRARPSCCDAPGEPEVEPAQP